MLRPYKVSRPQEINDFITEKRPDAVCDSCIADGVGVDKKSAHAPQITAALATTSDFDRSMGECSICGRTKLGIRSVLVP